MWGRSMSARRSFSGGMRSAVFEPDQQEFDRVPVGGDGSRRGRAFPGQVIGEEFRQVAYRRGFLAIGRAPL